MVISTTDKTFECPRMDLIGPGKTARDLSNVTPTLRLKQIHLPPKKILKNSNISNQSIQPGACALRALGLLLADGAPTVGRGKTF